MIKRTFTAFLIALLVPAAGLRAAELKWRNQPYTHMAQDEDLRDLLADFGADYGVRIVVSQRITDLVSGRFEGMDPRKFIEKICQAYGLKWYYDGASLFFYKNGEVRTRVFSLQFTNLSRLTGALRESGIWDDRYPVHAARSDDAVFVSGPPRFVDLVIETANRLEAKAMESAPTMADGQMVRIFPLRYAWAGDVTFGQDAAKQMTVPGVATLLNGLINKDPLSNTPPWGRPDGSASIRGLSQKSEDRPPEQLMAAMFAASQQARGRTSIFADSRTNSVVIKDSKENLQRFQSLVNSLDVPSGMVEITAAIIDLTDGSVRDLGLEWEQTKTTKSGTIQVESRQGVTFSELNPPKQGQTGPVVPTPPPLLNGYSLSTLVTYAGSSILARLNMMEQDGKAKINSRPAVLTFDNLRAVIAHTQTFMVRVSGERDANLFKIESGTNLRVTPHIVEDEGEKAVRLVVEIEDGSPSTDSQVDAIPTVSTSIVNTQAMVGNGQSLLLGGFVRTEVSEKSSQVPFLGSIPVIGYLFKRNRKVNTKMERVFMITPRIIESPAEAGYLFDADEQERRFQKNRASE
ncbi:MAG TPA: type III secretion system outer membrane ring subunit SctC [Fibrobacteria bacterium]|nr:type III secretion system outer membrane ring subunit SctC [Fibrobacteria bacterium]